MVAVPRKNLPSGRNDNAKLVIKLNKNALQLPGSTSASTRTYLS